jgi:hypothetical protein
MMRSLLLALLVFFLPCGAAAVGEAGGCLVGVDCALGAVAGHGDGSNCAAGEIPLGVDGDGNVQGCYEPTEADIADLVHTVEVNDLETIWQDVLEGEIAIGAAGDDAATYVTPSGDVTIGTSGVTTIGADKVLESMLKVTGAAAGDEECLTYETTVGDFEWHSCVKSEINDLSATGGTLTEFGALFIGQSPFVADAKVPTGDVTIDTAGVTTIGADKVLESMLKAVDAAADEECLTYETTTGDFEWETCKELPDAMAVVMEDCTDSPVAGTHCYETIGAALTALGEDAETRLIEVYPKSGDEGAPLHPTAYDEDVDCTPAAGHTIIRGVSFDSSADGGKDGDARPRGSPRIYGVADAGDAAAVTLDHCSLENFTIISSSDTGESGLTIAAADVDHVGVRNVHVEPYVCISSPTCLISNDPVIVSNQHIIDVLHYDGNVQFDNVSVTGIAVDVLGIGNDMALVYIDAGGAVAAGSSFTWDGGFVRLSVDDGGVSGSEPAAIQVTETPAKAMIRNIGIACEDTSTCFEINDEGVDIELSGITMLPALFDNNHGKLFDFKDEDSLNEDTAIIRLSDFRNLLVDSRLEVAGRWDDVLVTPIDYADVAFVSSENVLGRIDFTSYSLNVAGTGAQNCYLGWGRTVTFIAAGAAPMLTCQPETGTPGQPSSDWAEVSYHAKRVHIPPNVWVDGTECQSAGILAMGDTGTVKNTDTIVCTDSDDGKIQLSAWAPDTWRGSDSPDLVLGIDAICNLVDCNANLAYKVKAKCVGLSQLVDDTWGSLTSTTSMTFSSDTNERRYAETTGITPYCPGACNGRDRCWVQIETNESVSSGSLGNVYITGFYLEFQSLGEGW